MEVITTKIAPQGSLGINRLPQASHNARKTEHPALANSGEWTNFSKRLVPGPITFAPDLVKTTTGMMHGTIRLATHQPIKLP